MPEREGVKTLTPHQRRKAYARLRVGIEDRLRRDDDEKPLNRSTRRAMERELVKGLRSGRHLE